MKDNFDLKKFLTENKTIENSNPYLKEEKEISKKEEKSLKKVSKQLKKSVKAHGVQAKTIDKALKESEAGELNVYGYQTQHFDICPAATSLFKRILNGELGDLSEVAIKNMAKINDQLFLLEKKVIEKEQASEQQVIMAKMAQQALINLGLQMGIPEEEFDYVQAHVDKIKSFLSLKEESKDIKSKIREMIISELSEEETLEEAKEDEEEEIETDESEDTEEMEDEAPEEETEEKPETGGGIEDIAADMEGDEGDLMDHLISALKVSKAMDNDKLTTQIGNTLKFFVGEYIGGEE